MIVIIKFLILYIFYKYYELKSKKKLNIFYTRNLVILLYIHNYKMKKQI